MVDPSSMRQYKRKEEREEDGSEGHGAFSHRRRKGGEAEGGTEADELSKDYSPYKGSYSAFDEDSWPTCVSEAPKLMMQPRPSTTLSVSLSHWAGESVGVHLIRWIPLLCLVWFPSGIEIRW